ncbi:hypothetical protein L1987_09773 [Smallanthus sonchifolius]|uniref:Uncharacterized protein n=1 Tax=Smallanthus sonchifolius TaxID=185202 RepID=A0ACB9JQ94_9ASTR|nr:hypothetical protein L1987_09773 [Smallanthus sonchifolius]
MSQAQSGCLTGPLCFGGLAAVLGSSKALGHKEVLQRLLVIKKYRTRSLQRVYKRSNMSNKKSSLKTVLCSSFEVFG